MNSYAPTLGFKPKPEINAESVRPVQHQPFESVGITPKAFANFSPGFKRSENPG